jgi:hypothetical protein
MDQPGISNKGITSVVEEEGQVAILKIPSASLGNGLLAGISKFQDSRFGICTSVMWLPAFHFKLSISGSEGASRFGYTNLRIFP